MNGDDVLDVIITSSTYEQVSMLTTRPVQFPRRSLPNL